MGSWAAIAKIDSHELKQAVQRSDALDISVAVVDTNAIISGLQLDRIADTAVTIPEVFTEIRDKQARQTLLNLPFPLESQEPTEESVKAVLRFARATGDLHSLSTADIKLIALAHTLELARHGDSALRALPESTAVHKGAGAADRQLPGWNATGGTWSDMDKLAEEEILEAELKLAGILSKVSHAVQSLNINADARQPADQQSNASIVHQDQHTSADQHTAGSQPAEHHTEEEDVWQKASSSHNAARKKKRKQQRRAAWQADHHAEEAPEHNRDDSETSLAPPTPARYPSDGASAQQAASAHATHLAQPPEFAQFEARVDTDNADSQSPPSGGQHLHDGTVADYTHADESAQIPSQLLVASAENSGTAEPIQAGHAQQAHQPELNSADSSDHSDAASASDAPTDEQDQCSSSESEAEDDSESDEQEDQAGDAGTSQSSVASVTADFAMQNVILQMGLRLVAPNGMRIRKLTRWALRCSACFKITKEPGRLFCPHCGNATLDKVELTIGPDGSEQYGVRKRFNTRGTRFPLPKPKGGYQKNAPILREDVLMQKLNKRRNRKPKEEAVDAFAPEYGPDSWFQKNHGSAAQYKGAAAALASWRHNPNERKHSRSNRRKK